MYLLDDVIPDLVDEIDEDDCAYESVNTISLADEEDLVPDMDWSPTPELNIKPVIQLTPEQQLDFEEFFKEISEVFATDLFELGICDFLPFRRHERR